MQSCHVLLKLGKDKPRKPKTWNSKIAMQRITFKCMIPTTQQDTAYLILAVSKEERLGNLGNPNYQRHKVPQAQT